MVQVTMYVLLLACSFIGQVFSVRQIQYERAKAVKRDKERGLNYAKFLVDKFHYLNASNVGSVQVKTIKQCGLACVDVVSCFSFNVAASADVNGELWCELLSTDKYNSSDKLQENRISHHYSIYSPCAKQPCENGAKCVALYESEGFKCECRHGFQGDKCEKKISSCTDVRRLQKADADGVYAIIIDGNPLNVLCDTTIENKTWTLVARFSNNDTKNWMKDDGDYWYDRQSAVGQTTNPAANTDMISPAFWLVNATEFKMTRSDDSNHTALLQTTGNCLLGKPFRSKITSYGDFRNGKVWTSDKCLGSCDVQYGGQYKATAGFQKSQCDGNIQSQNKIGFWCDWIGGAAVMMIGGGGTDCLGADHGIGITEVTGASLRNPNMEFERDFGCNADNLIYQQGYSHNLWVR